MPRDVLGPQQPTGAEHAGDLSQRGVPIGHVMDDAELYDGIDAGAWLLDLARVPDRQLDRCAAIVQATLCLLDHGRVEVESGHTGGAEPVEQNLDAHASAASDLEDVLAGE